MITRILIITMMIGLLACGSAEMKEDDLKNYIANDEHGLHKEIEKNGITIEAFYKPSQMVWNSDISGEADHAKRELMIKACDTLTYFSLHFSRNGKEIENAYVSEPEVFERIVNYLSFDILNDLYLINGNDTVPAVDAVYARTFGAGTSTLVTAVFDVNIKEDAKGENVKLFLDDQMLETGLDEFAFQTSDIKKTPTLIFN